MLTSERASKSLEGSKREIKILLLRGVNCLSNLCILPIYAHILILVTIRFSAFTAVRVLREWTLVDSSHNALSFCRSEGEIFNDDSPQYFCYVGTVISWWKILPLLSCRILFNFSGWFFYPLSMWSWFSIILHLSLHLAIFQLKFQYQSTALKNSRPSVFFVDYTLFSSQL